MNADALFPTSLPEPAPAATGWWAGRDPTRFVLLGTSHPGNVGATARAMKVMGFADLVLVAPRFADVLSREETIAMASGAADILAHARIVPTLAEALEGVSFACATAMTPRDFGPPTFAPRVKFTELAAQMAQAQQVGAPAHRLALVFGSERFGMSNEEVYCCHACLCIPTAPDYGSLNLAQAVQLLAYEWRQALGGFAVQSRTDAPRLADAQAVQGVLTHWQQVLEHIGFLDPAAPKKLMPRLNQLLNRAELMQEEIHILRGMARAVERAARTAEPGKAP
jgi:tRNA/rRNA methyltransferase